MILDDLISYYRDQVDEAQAHINILERAQATINNNLNLVSQLQAKIGELQTRITELEKQTLPPIETNPSVLFQWDAKQAAPFFIHAKDPSRVSFVTAFGRSAVRLLTKAGDKNVNGSNDAERCDLRLGNENSYAREGLTIRIKHSVFFPDDYVDMPMSPANAQPWYWMSIMNFHDDDDFAGSQGPLQLMVYSNKAASLDRSTGIVFECYGGDTNNLKRGQFPLGPVIRNLWYDLEEHIKWTSRENGFCNGWVNGLRYMAYVGPTLHAGNGAYLKLANYHADRGDGLDSAVLHGPVTIYKG